MKEIVESFGVVDRFSVKAWETMLFHLHIGFLPYGTALSANRGLKQVREQLGLRTVIEYR